MNEKYLAYRQALLLTFWGMSGFMFSPVENKPKEPRKGQYPQQ